MILADRRCFVKQGDRGRSADTQRKGWNVEHKAAEKIWSNVLAEMQGSTEKQTYDTLLLGSEVQTTDNGTWTIAVRSEYAATWLQHRLERKIASVLFRHLEANGRGATPELVFVEATKENEKPNPTTSKSQPDATRKTQAPTQEPRRRNADEPILEAVREQRVAIDCNGKSLQYTDFYIRLKLAFRDRALRLLRGSKLSVFLCLALHVGADGVSSPGIEKIMEETDYSRQSVCTALAELVKMGFVVKMPRRHLQADRYEVKGYAWYGRNPAAALLEEE